MHGERSWRDQDYQKGEMRWTAPGVEMDLWQDVFVTMYCIGTHITHLCPVAYTDLSLLPSDAIHDPVPNSLPPCRGYLMPLGASGSRLMRGGDRNIHPSRG